MDPSVLQKIWPLFVEEAREHLQLISSGILEMERGTTTPQQMEAVRRTAHSLKGSAASLGIEHVEKLAHALENIVIGRDVSEKLEASLVEASLAAVEAAEQALARGDAGQEPTVPNLAELVEALGGKPAPKPAPAPQQGPSALEQIWPIFRGEACEHLEQLRAALAAHERRGEQGWTDEGGTLGRIAESLKASASLLGLRDMEALADTLAGTLAEAARDGQLEGARLQGLRAVLANLEHAVRADEVGTVVPAPAPAAATIATLPQNDRSLETLFRQEALETLAAIEESLTRLCSPMAENRPEQVAECVRRAHNLKGSAGALGAATIAALAAKIHDALPRMSEPGLEAGRAAAAIAGDLVDLRGAIESYGPAAAPAAAPAAPTPAATPTSPEPAPATEAKAAAEPAATGGVQAADRAVRVSVGSLDSLARQVESFTLVRSRQERRARELQSQAADAQEILVLCERAVSELRMAESAVSLGPLEETVHRLRNLQRSLVRAGQEVSREAEQARLMTTVVREDLKDLRMVPASTMLETLRRTVRDTAGRVKKQVELAIAGGDVRLDRRILEAMKDPLVHMVRNAIDHGLESAEVRQAAGKPAAGTLELRVERRGHRVAVVVADDGGGMSAEKVRAAAVKRGQISAAQAAQMDDQEALRLIFRAGVSTAEQVSAISGRGIGLDVVQEMVNRLGGTVEVDTTLGKGTRFTLDVPLTLAAALAVIVRVGNDVAAIPYEAVERILRLTSKDLGTVAGRASATIDDRQVPFASLAQVLGLPQGRLSLEAAGAQPALLVEAGGQRVAFAVEEVIDQQEIVVNSLGRHVSQTPHLGGAAVLEDGRVVAVLNPYELVRLARPLTRGKRSEDSKPRILVVDDSLTTRSAMKAVLEIAGYQVLPAGDGEEAWRLLQETPCQMVVSDVQMPRLDGLGLARRVKGDARLGSTPVILVTSLDAPTDRAAGLEAGADGYLVKREVERGKLLELVKQLLPA